MTIKIYKAYKMPTQSGNANAEEWLLEFVSQGRRFQVQVMGWTGNADMYGSEVKLRFQSKEQAIKFAKDKKVEYYVKDYIKPEYVIKKYTDNYL
jgi:hypothetical protein